MNVSEARDLMKRSELKAEVVGEEVHIPLSLRCPVCLAEPGNWSELQQHLAEHFSKMTDFEMPSWGKRRREKRSRCHLALGGRAGNSVSGQRGRTERADHHCVQDVPGSMLRERGRSNGRGRSTLPRIRWRNQEQARSRARRRSQLGPPYVHVWVAFLRSLAATRELAPEHVAVLTSYWESKLVKSAPVQLAAHVRHCRAQPCKKIEGKEGWTRIVFCLDLVTFPLEGALEAALQLQKGVRKHGPAPRGPLKREASRLLTQTRGKWSVWRTEWNNTVNAWLNSCVVVHWSLRWCMLS